jgi:hypothetical protein
MMGTSVASDIAVGRDMNFNPVEKKPSIHVDLTYRRQDNGGDDAMARPESSKCIDRLHVAPRPEIPTPVR